MQKPITIQTAIQPVQQGFRDPYQGIPGETPKVREDRPHVALSLDHQTVYFIEGGRVVGYLPLRDLGHAWRQLLQENPHDDQH
jgi:hypothetical protein